MNQLKQIGVHLPITLLRSRGDKDSWYTARFFGVSASEKSERAAKAELAAALAWASQEVGEPYLYRRGEDTWILWASLSGWYYRDPLGVVEALGRVSREAAVGALADRVAKEYPTDQRKN